MDDSTPNSSRKSTNRLPLGMSSFGPEEREQFGQNIRLAMACIEGKAEPVNSNTMPTDLQTIRQRLKALSQNMSSYHADLLELVVRFDELEGYKAAGASHCAAWMNLEIGISLKLAWEYLRVGRKLRLLPTTTALFRAGKLSWSKIRVLVNVANPDNEKTLCHAALDASVTDVVHLCRAFRWNEDDEHSGENELAVRQWEARSLTWDEASNGSTRIQLVLPPEIARAFLNSVEHSMNQLEDSDDKFTQRRADAAVLMAETSLQSAGRDFATADRYQVIVSADAADLRSPPASRPMVRGAGPIACETARRIACDCSLTTNTTSNGEPTDIGRKSRLWPPAMARAIKNRDQHCQFYGCTQTHNLQIHHIVHWADGGSTSISNGACLCQHHHTMVHEGGYSIEKVDNHEYRLNEQFAHQQHQDDMSLSEVEKALRNNRESFNTVRSLFPTRYRFRIVDADGRDIRHRQALHINGDVVESDVIDYSSSPHHSTRVECAEPAAGIYNVRRSGKQGESNKKYLIAHHRQTTPQVWNTLTW